MKINQEEFDRKAQHILDTVVKPQVEKYKKAKAKGKLKNRGSIYLNKELRREEMNAIGTIIILIVITIGIISFILQTIFDIV